MLFSLFFATSFSIPNTTPEHCASSRRPAKREASEAPPEASEKEAPSGWRVRIEGKSDSR